MKPENEEIKGLPEDERRVLEKREALRPNSYEESFLFLIFI